MQNYWATPDYLMQAVQTGFGVQLERFDCPLNYYPGMSNYFSPFLEDNVFGSTHNAGPSRSGFSGKLRVHKYSRASLILLSLSGYITRPSQILVSAEDLAHMLQATDV